MAKSQQMLSCAAWMLVAASCTLAASPSSRSIVYRDLAPEARRILAGYGTSAERFPALVRALDEETAARLKEGEADHLVFFVLQSKKFTARPAIEPALSAREFEVLGKVPGEVETRMQDFLRALDGAQADERLNWFRKSLTARERTPDYLEAEYARAMRFLYQKEFAAAKTESSSLYQRRGHSSDTRIESSFAVWNALAVLKKLDASLRLNRILIVGPGLDFAPRTAFVDSYPPQSYQPFAVADAVLDLGLASRDRLRIDCIDINDRVLDFFREFPRRPGRRLILFPGWQDPEYLAYFRKLGRQIGSERPIEGGKSLFISLQAAASITARKLNVITERYDPSPEYDLVVATNVLLYFSNTELLLVLSNIHSMLAGGGYLIHNELRPEVEAFSRELGFPPVEARTLRLSGAAAPGFFDSFIIHKKPARVANVPVGMERTP